MKTIKIISGILSFIITLLNFSPNILAGGIDRVEIYDPKDYDFYEGTSLSPAEGNTNVIYVSTRKIYDLVEFVQEEVNRYESRNFTNLGNGLYKAGIAAICLGACVGESYIKNKLPKVASIISTIVAGAAAFFVPEMISSNVNKHLNTGGHVYTMADNGHLREGEKSYHEGLKGLLFELRRASPNHYRPHKIIKPPKLFSSSEPIVIFKEYNEDEDSDDDSDYDDRAPFPDVSEGNFGLMIISTPCTKEGKSFRDVEIYCQCTDEDHNEYVDNFPHCLQGVKGMDNKSRTRWNPLFRNTPQPIKTSDLNLDKDLLEKIIGKY